VQRKVRQRRGEGRAARARDGGSAGELEKGSGKGAQGGAGAPGGEAGECGETGERSHPGRSVLPNRTRFLGTHANSVLEYIGTDRFLEKLGTEAIRYR